MIGRVLQFPCGGATVVPNFEEATAGYAILADPSIASGAWDELAWTERVEGHRTRFRDADVAYRARAISGMAGAEAEILFPVAARHERASLSTGEIDSLVWPDADDPRARKMARLRDVSGLAE